MPIQVMKNDDAKPLEGFSLKKIQLKIAISMGAEFTIIVAFETEVMSIAQCHRTKSKVKAMDAIAE